LAPPVELPDSDWTSGLLTLLVLLYEFAIPSALAAPKPVEGVGLELMPMAALSNVQAVSVVAAFTPESEASSKDAAQASLLIFIVILFGFDWSL
jgi:hypothetical protein